MFRTNEAVTSGYSLELKERKSKLITPFAPSSRRCRSAFRWRTESAARSASADHSRPGTAPAESPSRLESTKNDISI